MKRGFIIIFIFSILIGLCVLEETYLKSNLEELDKKSNELLVLVNNSEDVNTIEIEAKVKEIKDFWTKTEALFCLACCAAHPDPGPCPVCSAVGRQAPAAAAHDRSWGGENRKAPADTFAGERSLKDLYLGPLP